MTPTTVIVFACACNPRVVINNVCTRCGVQGTRTQLVERREVRTFGGVKKTPSVPPWARSRGKSQRVTRPGRR